jgi:NtrC-family two-component system response regulator AlgB
MANLLIVDDDRNAPPHVVGLLARAGHAVRLAETQRQALELLDSGECDLVLTNDRLGNASAFDIVEATRWSRPWLPVIVLAREASNDDALGYLRAGAFDYLEKSEPPREIVREVQRALESDGTVETTATGRDPAPFWAETTCPGVRSAIEMARAAAGDDDPVLIVGERGTGRRALARQIHAWSHRHAERCTVLPGQALALAEEPTGLFSGAPRLGATTAHGGDTLRASLLEGGTTILSGVGHLGLSAQRQLAEVLLGPAGFNTSSGGLGAKRGRIIATCEPGLRASVEAGRFRKDLHRCLSAVTIRLLPLRERGEDVIALAHQYLRSIGAEYDRHDLRLSSGAAAALIRHWWPGNVRELRDAIERAVATVADDGVVRADHLPPRIARRVTTGDDGELPPPTLEELERRHIARVLAQSDTMEQAAATLGIHTATLWRKRRRYQLR